MKYGSVCSGIEAATQAWAPLGWKAEFFSEIDKFPSAVLAHHYGSNMPGEPVTGNGIPNYGDMKEFERWPDHAIDILVGGTPCQDYSVAGLRAGMAGDRGSLTLTYIQIAARYRPRWIVWENVPGVLSSNSGKDFARFLGDISGTKITVPKNGWKTSGIVAGDPNAYGLAYRVLDTQYVRTCKHPGAIPQRRRRVFVVGYLGDWRSAAAVLLDPESLRRDLKPSRKAGKGIAGSAGSGVEGHSHWDGSGCRPSLNQSSNTGGIGASNQELFSQGGAGLVPAVSHTLKAEGFDASEDGTGRGTPIIPQRQEFPADVASTLNAAFGDKLGLENQHINSGAPLFVPSRTEGKTPLPIAFSSKDYGGDAVEGVSPTLRAGGHRDSHANAGAPPAVAFSFAQNQRGELRTSDVSTCLNVGGGKPGEGYAAVVHPIVIAERGRAGGQSLEARQDGVMNTILTPSGGRGGMGVGAIAHETDAETWAVRRLTPVECERLQGFPDDFTRIPWGKKTAEDCPDGHRYKALGNSMSTNVMLWIGARIEFVEGILND